MTNEDAFMPDVDVDKSDTSHSLESPIAFLFSLASANRPAADFAFVYGRWICAFLLAAMNNTWGGPVGFVFCTFDSHEPLPLHGQAHHLFQGMDIGNIKIHDGK